MHRALPAARVSRFAETVAIGTAGFMVFTSSCAASQTRDRVRKWQMAGMPRASAMIIVWLGGGVPCGMVRFPLYECGRFIWQIPDGLLAGRLVCALSDDSSL